MSKLSFIAGEAISRGEVVYIQGDDSVLRTPAADTTIPPCGVAFEDVESGSYGSFWGPGSVNVYCIADGTIAAGTVVAATGTAGHVRTLAYADAVSGAFGVGFAQTDATDGNPVYVSFSPINIK